MLIDDEQYDQMIYKRVLDRSGLVGKVHSFQYAEEALEFLKNDERPRIDLVFLDINMPRMNGFEFLDAATKILGEGFADAVIIMLTTSLDPKDMQKAKEYEVVRDFINKPLTVRHVENAVELLSNSSSI